MCELLDDKYMEKPQPGTDSTKALGATAPDPKQDIFWYSLSHTHIPTTHQSSTLQAQPFTHVLHIGQQRRNGVKIPRGAPKHTGIRSSCSHNEFVRLALLTFTLFPVASTTTTDPGFYRCCGSIDTSDRVRRGPGAHQVPPQDQVQPQVVICANGPADDSNNTKSTTRGKSKQGLSHYYCKMGPRPVARCGFGTFLKWLFFRTHTNLDSLVSLARAAISL